MPVSFGVQNHNVNAPIGWKRAETALITLLTGSIPLIGLTKSIDANLRDDLALVILPGLILLVKTFGILLGEAPVSSIENPSDKT